MLTNERARKVIDNDLVSNCLSCFTTAKITFTFLLLRFISHAHHKGYSQGHGDKLHFSVWSWLPLHLSAFSMGPHERFLVFVPKPQVSLQEDHSDQGGTMRNKYGSEEVDDHSISESLIFCFKGDI